MHAEELGGHGGKGAVTSGSEGDAELVVAADRSRRVVQGVGSLSGRCGSVMNVATIDHRTRTASPAAGRLTRPRQAEYT